MAADSTTAAPFARPPFWFRAAKGLAAGLDRVGLRARLDPDALIDGAERATGLSRWGEGDVREPLAVLTGALDREAGLHPLGRVTVRRELADALATRLGSEDLWARHPEIGDVPIVRPLIVAGMPRSGTTLLHRLLALEPSGRPLLFWEARWPVPPPDPATRDRDPRPARARSLIRALDAVAPDFVAGHEVDPEGPEECNGLFLPTFRHPLFGFIARVPSYLDWLAGEDMAGPYRHYKRSLQALSWKTPTGRWVLKAPAHSRSLGTLLATFPDARVVLLHRDPGLVVPSVAALAAAYRRMTSDAVDPLDLGPAFADGIAALFDHAIEATRAAPPGRIVPLLYDDLVADPVGSVRRVHAAFAIDHDPETDARVTAWLGKNPRHKRGVHRYGLAEFGLDRAAVDARFATYRDWARDQDRDG